MSKNVTAPVLQADIPTQNRNVYPREELERLVAKYLTSTEKEKLLVTYGLRQNISLEHVVGKVNKMHINADGTVIAEIEIFRDFLPDVGERCFNMCSTGKVRTEGDIKIIEEISFQYVSVGPTSAIVYPDSHD